MMDCRSSIMDSSMMIIDTSSNDLKAQQHLLLFGMRRAYLQEATLEGDSSKAQIATHCHCAAW